MLSFFECSSSTDNIRASKFRNSFSTHDLSVHLQVHNVTKTTALMKASAHLLQWFPGLHLDTTAWISCSSATASERYLSVEMSGSQPGISKRAPACIGSRACVVMQMSPGRAWTVSLAGRSAALANRTACMSSSAVERADVAPTSYRRRRLLFAIKTRRNGDDYNLRRRTVGRRQWSQTRCRSQIKRRRCRGSSCIHHYSSISHRQPACGWSAGSVLTQWAIRGANYPRRRQSLMVQGFNQCIRLFIHTISIEKPMQLYDQQT